MTEKMKKRDKLNILLPKKCNFRAELDGNKSSMNVILSGVNSVKDYSDKLLILRCRGFFVKLSGEGLRLSVFEDGSLSLSGKILGMELVYDRNC